MKNGIITLAAFLFVIGISFSNPLNLNVHGYLYNASTNTTLNGTHNLTFTIYDDYAAGNILYNTTKTDYPVDFRGYYRAILYGVEGVNFSAQTYLGVQVDMDAEISPRTNLTSVPSALMPNVTCPDGQFISAISPTGTACGTPAGTSSGNVTGIGIQYSIPWWTNSTNLTADNNLVYDPVIGALSSVIMTGGTASFTNLYGALNVSYLYGVLNNALMNTTFLQNYNETAQISSVNSTVVSLQAYNVSANGNIATLNTTKLNITDQRFNETAFINGKFGTLTDNMWCIADGGKVVCEQLPPATVAHLNSVNATVTSLQAYNVTANNNIAALNSSNTTTVGRLDTLNSTVVSLQSYNVSANGNIAALNTSNGTTNSRIDSLNTTKAGTAANSTQCTGTDKLINISISLGTTGAVVSGVCSADLTGSGVINTVNATDATLVVQNGTTANFSINQTTLVSIIGNWSADKPSYTATSGLVAVLAYVNNTANGTSNLTIAQVTTANGNWTADKPDYTTTANLVSTLAYINNTANGTSNLTLAQVTTANGNWSADKSSFANLSANNTFTGNQTLSSGLLLTTATTKPACASGNRGMLWTDRGGAGVADLLFWCAKNATDNYNWVQANIG